MAIQVQALSTRSTRHLQIAVAVAALLVGAVLRFYALDRRGLLYWDEAKFALEGLRFHFLLQHALGEQVSLLAGKAVGTAKPTHALLIGVSYGVLGVRDYAPLYLNAVCSLAVVALVCALGRRLFSPAVGLIASLLLAVSTFDIIYARSALSESDANLFLLLGVLSWTYSYLPAETGGRERVSTRRLLPLLLAALVLGIGFTTSYRLAIYIGTLVGLDLLWALICCWKWAPVRAVCWAAGLVAAPALWQIVDSIARRRGVVLFRSEMTGHPEGYLRQVVDRVQTLSSSVSTLNWQQIQWYAERQGPVMLVLLVLSLVAVLRFRSLSWVSTAALVAIPLLATTASPEVVARSFEAAIPLASLLVAAVLARIAAWRSWARILVALVLVAILGYNGFASWQLTAERSGYREAATQLSQRGEWRALTSSEVMLYYLRGTGRRCLAPRIPPGLDGLAADINAGYHYAILDYNAKGFVSRVIHHHGRRVGLYLALGSSSLPPSLISSETGSAGSNASNDPYVELYQIDMIHLPPPRDARPGVCLRDLTR